MIPLYQGEPFPVYAQDILEAIYKGKHFNKDGIFNKIDFWSDYLEVNPPSVYVEKELKILEFLFLTKLGII